MAVTRTKKTLHCHACSACKGMYHDSCETPATDRQCNPCVSGIPSDWGKGSKPKACCVTQGRLARKDEIARYCLVGGSNWWICPHCQRRFATKPRAVIG